MSSLNSNISPRAFYTIYDSIYSLLTVNFKNGALSQRRII